MVSKASLQNCNTRAKNGILPFIQSVVPLSLAAMFRIRSVNAVETKLEYMPALKGLDYGKVSSISSIGLGLHSKMGYTIFIYNYHRTDANAVF